MEVMKKIPNKGMNGCTFKSFDEKDKQLEHCGDWRACYGGIYNMNELWKNHIHKNPYYIIYIEKELMPYTFEDLQLWIPFMVDCGFPCSLQESDDKHHKIFVPVNQYRNYVHLFSGMTAIRYIFYCHESYLTTIPEVAYEIKTLHPEWDSLQCLLLAHYCKDGYWDTDHSLLYSRSSVLLTKDQLLKRCNEKYDGDLKYSCANDLCTVDSEKEVSTKTIYKLITNRDKDSYQKAFDLLNNKNKKVA